MSIDVCGRWTSTRNVNSVASVAKRVAELLPSVRAAALAGRRLRTAVDET